MFLAVTPLNAQNTSAEVGTLPGNADVTPSGGASYYIPLEVPEGVAGMTPSLSLNYNSQAGNGIMGIGWNLGGLGSISRTGQEMYFNGKKQGIKFNAEDGLMFNGQRLVSVGNGEWRTEMESFVKITEVNGSPLTNPLAYFRIEDKDGTVSEYGGTGKNIFPYNITQASAWYLTKITDTYGNYIEYKYFMSDPAPFALLDQVLYGGNIIQGTPANIKILFDYQYFSHNRVDDMTSFYQNGFVRSLFLMSGIKIYVNDTEQCGYYLDYKTFSTVDPANAPNVKFYDYDKKIEKITKKCGTVSLSETTVLWNDASPELQISNTIASPFGSLVTSGDFLGNTETQLFRLTGLLAPNPGSITNLTYTVETTEGDVVMTGTITPPVSDINAMGAGMNLLSNRFDYDGDGYDDVLIQYMKEVSMPNSSYQWDKAWYQVWATRKTSTGYTLEKIDEFESLFYGAFTDKNDVRVHPIIGDYNGDGRSDILIYNEWTDGIQFRYIPRNTTTPVGFIQPGFFATNNTGTDRKNAFGGDFNGDGKSDALFLVLTPAGSTGVASIITLNDAETAFVRREVVLADETKDLINYQTGDFNGDGLTDLLGTRIIDEQYDENDDVRHILLTNNGISLRVNENVYESCKDRNVVTGDFNGDGQTDLLMFWNTLDGNNYAVWQYELKSYRAAGQSGNFYQTVLISKGSWGVNALPFDFQTQTPDPSIGTRILNGLVGAINSTLDPFGTNQANMQSLVRRFGTLPPATSFQIADFNGDGKADFFASTFDFSGGTIFSFGFEDKQRLVRRIENGLGEQVKFNYKTSAASNNLGTSTDYDLAQTFEYPFNNRVFPGYLVKSIEVENGVPTFSGHSFVEKNYDYWQPINHVWGKGFLGYKKTVSYTYENQLYSAREIALDCSSFNGLEKPGRVTIVKEKTYTTDNANTTLLSVKLSEYSLFGIANKRHFQYLVYSDTEDFLNQLRVQQYYNYGPTDIYFGNISSILTQYLGAEPETQTQTFGYTYTTAFWGGRNTSFKLEKQKTGQAVYTRNRAMTYNVKGKIASITHDPSKPKSVVKNLRYDDFGNVNFINKTEVSTGLVRGLTTIEYSHNGRFISKSKEANGAYPLVNEWLHEGVWGNVIEAKDENNLVTRYQYDVFNRIKKETSPTGVMTDIAYNWIAGDPDAPLAMGAKYSIKTAISGISGTRAAYFDKLNRSIKEVNFDLFGNKVIQSVQFDNLGHLKEMTAPASNSTTSTYKYEYDSFGRATKATGNSSTNTIFEHIEYAYNGRTTTTTDVVTGQSKSSSINDAGKLKTVTDQGGTIQYSYHSNGKPMSVSTNGTTTAITYDDYGNRVAMTEPNTGNYSWTYNSFGEPVTANTPKGNYTYQYDILGRETQKVGPEGTYTNTYDSQQYGKGLPAMQTSPNSITYTYEYDAFSRPKKRTENIQGTILASQLIYDTYGRVATEVFPNNTTISHFYSAYGGENMIKNLTTVIWEATAVNQYGQITAYRRPTNTTGQYITTDNTFTPQGFLARSLSKKGTTEIDDWTYTFDPATGNLTDRKDQTGTLNLLEEFTYDNLDRLKTVKQNGTLVQTMGYAPNGNLTSKTDAGNYGYGTAKPNAVATLTGNIANIPTAQQDITYTTFNKVATITENSNTYNLTYGPNQQRVKSVQTIAGTVTTKFYTSNFEREVTNGITKDICYIYAGGELIAMHEKNGTTTRLLYTITDHLGSLTKITDKDGNLVEQHSFDAWGRYRNPYNWSYSYGAPGQLNQSPLNYKFTRGYTGHEHLLRFGIINMNGRIYDPILGQMMSPDPLVSSPTATQGYNRFSYVLNNPLKYTDPTGYSPFGLLVEGGTASTMHSFGPNTLSTGIGNAAAFMMVLNGASSFVSGFNNPGWTGTGGGLVGGSGATAGSGSPGSGVDKEESTEVTQNADGTYTVVNAQNDGDNNIYVVDDKGNRSGETIGTTIRPFDFMGTNDGTGDFTFNSSSSVTFSINNLTVSGTVHPNKHTEATLYNAEAKFLIEWGKDLFSEELNRQQRSTLYGKLSILKSMSANDYGTPNSLDN